jgi:hypothetical protein
MELIRIGCIKNYREMEEKTGKRRKPSKVLYQKIKEHLSNLGDKMAVDPNADIIYFPGSLNKGEFYFRDQHAKTEIRNMLDKNFKFPENLENNLDQNIAYALALRGAFFSLKEGFDRKWGNIIPIQGILLLTTFLSVLLDKTKDLKDLVNKNEEIGDRNSRNSSTRTPARIEDYKKHEKYPELEQMIKSYQGTPKELREINKLMADILDTKNKVTIRRYRHLFFEDLQK